MWEKVGIFLRLKTPKLKAIAKDHTDSCEDACFEMLLSWKELDFNVSRRMLDQAIKDCKWLLEKKGMPIVYNNKLVNKFSVGRGVVYWTS